MSTLRKPRKRMPNAGRKMVVQWTPTPLRELLRDYNKFRFKPGVEDNFEEALEKLKVPTKRARNFRLMRKILKLLEVQKKPLCEIKKIVVWEAPMAEYDIEFDLFEYERSRK